MKKIYKYPIPMQDQFEFYLPKNASILDVQIQDNSPVLWALLDFNEKEKEIRKFILLGTGHPTDRNIVAYIGTFQLGEFVGHVFEVSE